MKIISKFHDYYDSLVNFGGNDNTKIYNRTTYTLDALQFPPTHKRPSDLYLMFNGHKLVSSHYHSLNNNIEIESFIVIFAGISYTGIRVELIKSLPEHDEVTYHYTCESLFKYLNDISLDIIKDRKKSIIEFYDSNKSSCARDWAINNQIIIATDCTGFGSRHTAWIANPQLNKISFQKALDPFTAFQELEMWIGGVLTENKELYQVPNDIKIQQAGFDLKTSFRRPKQS